MISHYLCTRQTQKFLSSMNEKYIKINKFTLLLDLVCLRFFVIIRQRAKPFFFLARLSLIILIQIYSRENFQKRVPSISLFLVVQLEWRLCGWDQRSVHSTYQKGLKNGNLYTWERKETCSFSHVIDQSTVKCCLALEKMQGKTYRQRQ